MVYPLWAAVAIAELMDLYERRRWLAQFDPSSRAAVERELATHGVETAEPPRTLVENGVNKRRRYKAKRRRAELTGARRTR